MPFFRKKGDKEKEKKVSISKEKAEEAPTKSESPVKAAGQAKPGAAKVDSLQPSDGKKATQPIGPPPKDLAFAVQLAHGSGTQKVRDFTTVKQLYTRIAEEFKLEQRDLFYCTLGTDRVDTDRLLGGQIGLNDVIFVHVRGEAKEVTIHKDAAALGLTITDNGAGCAFIKRIKDGSLTAKVPEVLVGDHIAEVNGRVMFGTRHLEVAKTLKELPVGEDFTIKLYSPLRSPFISIAPRAAKGASQSSSLSDDAQLGTGKQTLRLKSTGQATVQTVDESSWTVKAIEAVDDCLESFMGIRDNELAETAVDSAREAVDLASFKEKINVDLEVFEFPESFVEELWSAIMLVKNAGK